MDIVIANVTPYWIFFQIILLNIALLPFLFGIKITKRGKISYGKSYPNKNVLFFICWIFCIFSTFDGDWFHYRNIFRGLIQSNFYITHLEEVYPWIIENLSLGSYVLFRAIVWGGALYFYKMAFKRLNLNGQLTWIGMVLTTLLNVSYMRGMLGFGILLYGYTFLLAPTRHKIKSYIFAIILMSISLCFHKSMYIVLFTAVASLLPLKKYFYILIVLSFPILILIFQSYILPSFTNDSAGSSYLHYKAEAFGIGRSLYNYLCYIYVFGTILFLIKEFVKDKMPKYVRHSYLFLTYTLLVYGVSYFGLELQGVGGKYLSNRIFLMAFCIFPVIFTYQLNRKNYGWQNIILIYAAFLSVNYRLLYAYYLQTIDMPG